MKPLAKLASESTMDNALKQIVKDTFDAVADGYDHPALRFFSAGAEHIAQRLALHGDEEVLDVACGTGHVTTALARRLPHGHVTAVDFSPSMLSRARSKVAATALANVEFVERDMQALGWHERFHAAVCAFGIFFVEEMEQQLCHIAETVKPDGRIMVSNFATDYMDPPRSLMYARVRQYGVTVPPQTWQRIGHEEGCRQLFAQAGLVDITVEQRNLGYFLASADDWWSVIWNAGFRRLVSRVAPAEQARFKQEHLAEVEALRTPEGIRLDIPVLFTCGRKSE